MTIPLCYPAIFTAVWLAKPVTWPGNWAYISSIPEWDGQVEVQVTSSRLELLKNDLRCCHRSELHGPGGGV